MSEELLDEADRILIATVDTAIEVGLARTFTTPAGHVVRVEDLGEVWVKLAVFRGGFPTGETLDLPRDIRRIAIATAELRRRGAVT